ncbi:hypothetical protein A5667_27415 [Mycolicibacterium fortuitum]|nr:hypothetical protein A5667_27415 [Mycolicibacterium fortuitum]
MDGECGLMPSSLLYANGLIWIRGLLVTQAAELKAGLRELLSLATRLLRKSPLATTLPPDPPRQLPGPGKVLAEVNRLLKRAHAAGLLSSRDHGKLQLAKVQPVCTIRNQSAHAQMRTEYAAYGGSWQPIWAWFNMDEDVACNA